MATVTLSYGTRTAITMDPSALGTSSTFVAGVESAEQDNSSDLFLDVLVEGYVTGHASTAPTVGQEVRLYVWGSNVSLGTTAIDVLDGTSSAETIGHVAQLNALRLAGVAVVTVATAALTYNFLPFSVAALFGGSMPKYWGLFLAHNHTGALGAAIADKFYKTGIKATVA
jgi:hypothetical protein